MEDSLGRGHLVWDLKNHLQMGEGFRLGVNQRRQQGSSFFGNTEESRVSSGVHGESRKVGKARTQWGWSTTLHGASVWEECAELRDTFQRGQHDPVVIKTSTLMALQWKTVQGGQKRLVKQCRQELGGLPHSGTGDSQPYKSYPVETLLSIKQPRHLNNRGEPGKDRTPGKVHLDPKKMQCQNGPRPYL